tara:strand:+ start:4017 stop:5801 length:1785 start_codon:yes stop_codon:yes gene_type:complete
MSLICLSSRGLSVQPENFSNFFGGRGIEFPKNSEICLVGASVRKHAPGRAVVSLTSENNTFACHYGAAPLGVGAIDPKEDLLRDDVYTINPQTGTYLNIAALLQNTVATQCTPSCLSHGVTSTMTGPVGWTLKQPMWNNRRTQGGRWSAPPNAPQAASDLLPQDSGTFTRLQPNALSEACWMEDSRVLWNTDNGGRPGNFGAALEGCRFNFYRGGPGNDPITYNGWQGGIVTGNRIGNASSIDSWVNFPVPGEDFQPALGMYEQKIDLGWAITLDSLQWYKNAYTGDGYKRELLGEILLADILTPQQIQVGFRPLLSATGTYDWEIFYQLSPPGAPTAWVQAALVEGTPADGTFPFGKYNANQTSVAPVTWESDEISKVGVGHHAVACWGIINIDFMEVYGCYDDMLGTPEAPAASFGKDLTFGTSYISDSYAQNNGIWNNFKQICQSRCTIADSLGFYSGVVKPVTDAPAGAPAGLVSEVLPAAWNFADAPLVVQLPNLPITGYLGGGASAIGGATALPVLGIIDGFQIDEDPSNSISSPYNENWIKLLNKESFTINEMQVRITDMYGVLPDYLDNPSHVWIKIRAGRGEVTV